VKGQSVLEFQDSQVCTVHLIFPAIGPVCSMVFPISIIAAN
jgi:hypothetical protein